MTQQAQPETAKKKVITTFIVNPQVLQNIADYMVERPFKEVASLLESLQTSAVVTESAAEAVLAVANKDYLKAADILASLVPEKATPVKSK